MNTPLNDPVEAQLSKIRRMRNVNSGISLGHNIMRNRNGAAFRGSRITAFGRSSSPVRKPISPKLYTAEDMKAAEDVLLEIVNREYGSLEGYLDVKYQPLIKRAKEWGIDLSARRMQCDPNEAGLHETLSDKIRNIKLWVEGESAVLTDRISTASVRKPERHENLVGMDDNQLRFLFPASSIPNLSSAFEAARPDDPRRVVHARVEEVGKIALRSDWPQRDVTVSDHLGNLGTVTVSHVQGPIEGFFPFGVGNKCMLVADPNGHVSQLYGINEPATL